jgi:hypothetical protein
LPFRNSSRSFELKLSQKPFSHGEPGWMYSVFAPMLANHLRRSRATNSGPLSERKCSGTPLINITSASVSINLALDQRHWVIVIDTTDGY